MYLANMILAIMAAVALAMGSPTMHPHGHLHVEKRIPDKVVIEYLYEVNHNIVGLAEVCAGLKAKILKLANGGDSLEACSAEAPAYTHHGHHHHHTPTTVVSTENDGPTVSKTDLPVSAVSSTSVPSVTVPALTVPNVTNLGTKPTTTVSSTVSSVSSEGLSSSSPVDSYSAQPSSDHSLGSSDNSYGGKGVDRDFPDGEIDCSDFPSDYGPIEIDWMGIGGWSGIQYPTYGGGFIVNIDTAVPGGDNCTANALCSYACPPGFQKSQWPTTQGSTGQSVGGLQCNQDGKLTLTNPSLSKKLCIKGTGATKVHNKLSKNAAICRTDYPGTESQTVPLNTDPDTISPLTCPDSKFYYKHEGKPTTAQYYVNNQGVDKTAACIWGTDGSHQGNWAPTYFGVGRDLFEKTWLSIASTAQNLPTDYQPLDYCVELVAVDNGKLSGTCRLSNGRYCSGDNYEICNDQGCTVELLEGEALYVLTDSC